MDSIKDFINKKRKSIFTYNELVRSIYITGYESFESTTINTYLKCLINIGIIKVCCKYYDTTNIGIFQKNLILHY